MRQEVAQIPQLKRNLREREPKKKETKEKSNGPKRPKTAYMFFAQSMRVDLKKKISGRQFC